jgi:hypothetical protein
MDRLVVTRAEALLFVSEEVSFPHSNATVILSTDADVIMFVNLCDNNVRGKQANPKISLTILTNPNQSSAS